VASTSLSNDQEQALAAAAASFPHANLPGRLIGMVGRDDDVLKLSARLHAARFVTIVGAGGVGKTTVAQAVERARQTVKDAASMEHSLTLSIALIRAISVFLWGGDLESAEEHADWLIASSESLAPYLAVGRGFKGQWAIRRGDAEGGVEILRSSLEKLHAMRYELITTEFNISLVQGLAAIGQLAQGIGLIEETIRLVDAKWRCLIHSGAAAREGWPASCHAEAQPRRRRNVFHAVAPAVIPQSPATHIFLSRLARDL
jgi:hypothetical protein